MAFEPFTAAHYAGIAIAVVLAAAIVAFRKRLRSEKADRAARLGLTGLLVGCEFSLYAWYEATDNWGWYSLPFQLCSLMVWASALLLITRSRKVYEVAFFLGILGAMQALLTPDLDAAYPQFRYFHFFFAHAAIIGANVYLTAVIGYRPRFASALKAIGWLHVLAVPAAIANAAAGTNFMFLARKPPNGSLLDLLSPWPWYLLELEIVAFAMCMALYGIVKLVDRLKRGRRLTSPIGG